jgi:hypothetical protein
VVSVQEERVQGLAESGVVTTRIRTRWCRVRIRLYQLTGIELVSRDPGGSENRLSGSPTRTRTWNNPVNSRVLYH